MVWTEHGRRFDGPDWPPKKSEYHVPVGFTISVQDTGAQWARTYARVGAYKEAVAEAMRIIKTGRYSRVCVLESDGFMRFDWRAVEG